METLAEYAQDFAGGRARTIVLYGKGFAASLAAAFDRSRQVWIIRRSDL